MPRTIRFTNTFKKDLKLIKKQGKDINKLTNIVSILSKTDSLPIKYRAHKLIGNYNNKMECHIEPDWLLIYELDKNFLTLYRTGSHSNLFK